MNKIVTIGGGTGSYTVLSGIKNLPQTSITALVSMADNGGSTGVLRDELGVLPAGDVRQCLVALSEHSEEVRSLMSYRFNEGSLKGHSFGNIFLAALEKVTGNFAAGVEIASNILKIKGKVLPITQNSATLAVLFSNGEITEGENNIQNAKLKDGFEKIFYNNQVNLNNKARKSLIEADVIILGPGNYYCSVVPNLIVNGFEEALVLSKAKIIFPVNLTNKHEHTANWKVSDYVFDIEKYLGKKVDIILVNNKAPSKEQAEYYESEEGHGVWVDDDMNDPRVVRDDLLSDVIFKPEFDENMKATRGFIRHDSRKLAKAIAKIIGS